MSAPIVSPKVATQAQEIQTSKSQEIYRDTVARSRFSTALQAAADAKKPSLGHLRKSESEGNCFHGEKKCPDKDRGSGGPRDGGDGVRRVRQSETLPRLRQKNVGEARRGRYAAVFRS